jgi:hypothetical protein
MRPGVKPPIPIITTSCAVYERILLADHVMLVAEGEAPEPGMTPYFATRQCLLRRKHGGCEGDMLLRMVGG